jgi:transcriptional regulator with XRE-family HTH domain
MTPSIGALLKQARDVRKLSAVDTALAAGISAAYLSKLERNAVKKPSPHVLHQLSEALALPYAELMRLSGYRVPGESNNGTNGTAGTVGAALFADITEDEREELLEYLAWYRARRRWDRARRRSSRSVSDSGPDAS